MPAREYKNQQILLTKENLTIDKLKFISSLGM